MKHTDCDQNDPTACGVQMYGMVKVGEKGQVVIPKDARDLLGIKSGDNLLVVVKHQKAIGLIKQEDLETFIKYLQDEISFHKTSSHN